MAEGAHRFSRAGDPRKPQEDFAFDGDVPAVGASEGLQPSETRYVRRTLMGTVDLQFSKSADPAIEKSYRTNYVSPALSERKQQQIKERLSRAAQPVVFQILRDSHCSECGAELASDSYLFMETEQPLCLPCARLGDLEYLPAGDTALTRRAAKYSGRKGAAVVPLALESLLRLLFFHGLALFNWLTYSPRMTAMNPRQWFQARLTWAVLEEGYGLTHWREAEHIFLSLNSEIEY